MYVKKNYLWNPATCNCGILNKFCKYYASIMDNSGIMCDSIIWRRNKNNYANFNEEKTTCKTQNFYILLTFFFIAIALLIAVSIYCYLIKYWAKQKHLWLFQFTNSKLTI